MGRDSKIDPALFKRMWNNPEISRDDIAQHFGVSPAYATQVANKRGLMKRKTGPKLQLVVSNSQPAKPAAKAVSQILQTGGKYALLCAYADANGLSYAKALQLWHRERAAK